MYRLAALVLSSCLFGACVDTGPGPVSQADGQVAAPARFARIDRLMRSARARALVRDAAGITAMRGPISSEGLALLRGRIPHDLRRQDVPRFLDGRRLFGDALSRWVAVLESGAGAEAILRATSELDDATQGWIDAYLGRATESAV